MLKHTVSSSRFANQIFCPFVIDHAVLREADAARGAVQQLSARGGFPAPESAATRCLLAGSTSPLRGKALSSATQTNNFALR